MPVKKLLYTREKKNRNEPKVWGEIKLVTNSIILEEKIISTPFRMNLLK